MTKRIFYDTFLNMASFSHRKIEKKWDAIWRKKKIFEPDIRGAKKPFYTLMMFPYPSAEGLHIGGARTYTGVDMYGRFKRMQGYDVFEPIGLDGFGIHSENYALKVGEHPMKLAKKTERNFYRQLQYLGNGFAWDEKVETYDPKYYRWTQWVFTQMFKRGLAYRKKALVNWCPSCLTVLADEQVIGGECERCGTPVIKKELEQWFLKITDYADRLLKNLETLDWSDVIKSAQKNWIGKSEGAELDFKIIGVKDRITVFTTRPETLFGATYLVLAPEHPFIADHESQIVNYEEVRSYIEAAKKKSEADRIAEGKEKTGIKLEGLRVLHPATGEEILVFTADYVVGTYGTGAIMAVPAHDERDFEFAKKFNLPIKAVISPLYGDSRTQEERAYTGVGYLMNSGKFNGMKSEDAKKAITDYVGGRVKTTYRLRDWLISRQRYWGPPIPMIHCNSCGWVPVPEKDLPVKLPFIKNFRPTGTGQSPLASVETFYKVHCPQCKGWARRETDVSDTFLDSSWYFLRYPSARDAKNAWNPAITKKWLPVHMYIGGAEHAVLHLLYSRFVTMALYDAKLLDREEPFSIFRAHGLITKDGAKMSKSKGNVVSPDTYFKMYGADTMRMYLAFLAPLTEGGDFRDEGISGITRFLNRVWTFGLRKTWVRTSNGAVTKDIHKTIKKVTEDIERLHYNTAISALMILFRTFQERADAVTKKDFEVFIKLLAPFAPFLSEEVYQMTRSSKKYLSVHRADWPNYDETLLAEDSYTLVVQINGKVRDQFEVPSAITQREAEALTEKRKKVTNFLKDRVIEKVIFVPKRLINFVIR